MAIQAPAIQGASSTQSAQIEKLSQGSHQGAQRSAEVGGAFSEVLDLVKPRELPKADESAELSRVERRDEPEQSEVEPREDASVKESQRSEQAQVASDSDSSHRDDGLTERGEAAAKLALSAESKSDRAEALKLVQQLSQEDLLKLIELSEGQSAALNPELTAFEAEAIPAIKALSAHELMALLHGFQDAQQPQAQAQLAELFGQGQLPEQGLTQGTQAQAFVQALTQQVNQQVNQPQVNPNAIAPNMQSVVRPQEVMPALNQVKLSASQREGIIRQVAHGFRTRSGGTQTTEIRLNPEELGLVRLKVEMRGADVRVFFAAENPAVMELLSENIDQLKALLTEQEFNLTEAGVWQEFNQGRGSDEGAEGEDYGSDERPDLRHRPKSGRRMSPLPGRFRATV